MNISIFCKVVDNFGDIGVCYRLAKRLQSINPDNVISLVVSNLDAFHSINNQINSALPYQVAEGLEIYDWNAEDFCFSAFSADDGAKLGVILECFQCGRPEWLDKILFDDHQGQGKAGLSRIVQIIMIDYLTAEKYADDFHCLQSLTRSSKVRKVNFMPGFTEKTGGLIIGQGWEKVCERNVHGPVLFFMYDNDWQPLASALKEAGRTVLVGQGKGRDSFVEAASRSGFRNLEILPFMNQDQWDDMMKSCSALFVRGEESLARACLSGIPFVWQAYPQSDEYQLVKVKALLDLMKSFFEPEDFDFIYKLWIDFNSPNSERNDFYFEKACLEFLEKLDALAYGFLAFALSLRKNGDLGSNLMTYIEKIAIMD